MAAKDGEKQSVSLSLHMGGGGLGWERKGNDNQKARRIFQVADMETRERICRSPSSRA